MNFIQRLTTGCDYGSVPKIIWKSKDGRFLILTIAGHNQWQGIGMKYEYQVAEHFLCDTEKFSSKNECGFDLLRKTCLRTTEGRFLKPVKLAWIELVTASKIQR